MKLVDGESDVVFEGGLKVGVPSGMRGEIDWLEVVF